MRRHKLDEKALPMVAHLSVAGCECVVHTNAASVISSLGKWRAAGEVRAKAGFELAVVIDAGLRREEVVPEFRGRGRFVFAVFHGTEMFAFDLLRRRVSAVVSEETAQDSGFWKTVMIPIAMGVLGPMMGVAPLHSACLEMDGRGILLAGISGAGKSTLATAMAMQGMGLVSDDWVYACVEESAVSVHGLSVPVKLMPDTAEHFEQLRGEQARVSLNGELAYEMDARRLGIQIAESCEPECIVFLERTGHESQIERVERSLANRFFECSAEPLPPEFSQATEKRRRIIEAVTDRDCWLFRYAGAPQQGATMLKKFFEETYNVEPAWTSAS